MASGFHEVYENEFLKKVRANFGRGKEVCISMHNNRTYLHISDKSKAFVNGKFDVSKCKSVSLGHDEVVMLTSLLGYFEYYAYKLTQEDNHNQPKVTIPTATGTCVSTGTSMSTETSTKAVPTTSVASDIPTGLEAVQASTSQDVFTATPLRAFAELSDDAFYVQGEGEWLGLMSRYQTHQHLYQNQE